MLVNKTCSLSSLAIVTHFVPKHCWKKKIPTHKDVHESKLSFRVMWINIIECSGWHYSQNHFEEPYQLHNMLVEQFSMIANNSQWEDAFAVYKAQRLARSVIGWLTRPMAECKQWVRSRIFTTKGVPTKPYVKMPSRKPLVTATWKADPSGSRQAAGW